MDENDLIDDEAPAPVIAAPTSPEIAERLASLAANFASANTMDELGACAREAIESLIGVEYNGLYLWDDDQSGLRLLYSVGFSEDERREAERTALDRHPGAVFRRGEILHVPDVRADPSAQSTTSPRSFEVRSRLFVPVTFREEVLGVFGLASAVPNRFSPEDIALTRFVCRLAGVVCRRLLDKLAHEEAQGAIQRALERANIELFDSQVQLLAANEELEARVAERTRALEERNASLAEALAAVERTREQMIQSEKLASLGMLVAGIAHEIKNPLNFVNNFAELSIELAGEVDDLLDGLGDGGRAVAELVADIAENLRRIHEHGHRATDTINAMLMHARERGGEVVRCDLNAVAREHAVLAYQGVRSRDRDFVAQIETDFDERLGSVELPLQEVSRVILNLVTNACHAIRDRARRGEPGYVPTITLTTRLRDGALILAIRDNGTGIAPEVRDKLFVPFFTTKRAGEGTGLGLSMSYDIVVKQLGGRLRVDSEPDAYTEFTIEIPHPPAAGPEGRG